MKLDMDTLVPRLTQKQLDTFWGYIDGDLEQWVWRGPISVWSKRPVFNAWVKVGLIKIPVQFPPEFLFTWLVRHNQVPETFKASL